MSSVELLAMQVPCSADASAMAGGGLRELTPELLSVACAGLDRGPYAVARWVVCLDRSAATALEQALWVRLAERATAEGWRSQRGRDLCRLVVVELGRPRLSRRRPGQAREGVDARTRPWRDADRARELGVDAASWSRLWSVRYAAVWALACAWLDAAGGHVARRLRG